MTEKKTGGFSERLAGAFEQAGLGEAFGELRGEILTLGRELAVAGLAAAGEVRAAAQATSPPEPPKQASQAPEAPSGVGSVRAATPGRRSLRPRGRGRVVAALEDDAEVAARREAAAATQASIGELGQTVSKLSGQLDQVCRLLDAVAGLVEEQTERLETVEEMLEQLERSSSRPLADDPLSAWASAPPPSHAPDRAPESISSSRVLLLDPDGVRASFLAGSVGVAGARVSIATALPDALQLLSLHDHTDDQGWLLAVHADTDLPVAHAAVDALEDARRSVIVYYTSDDAGAQTAGRAATLCNSLGVGSVVESNSDARALLGAIDNLRTIEP